MQAIEIFNAIHEIVNQWGREPKRGFVANELSVTLANGLEVSIEGRCGRGCGVAIARVNGELVAHQFSGSLIAGKWIDDLNRAFGVVSRQKAFQAALPDYFTKPVQVVRKSPLETENGYLMADAY
jgi:hypothetical protein